MTDDDWSRYRQLGNGIELVEFNDSPHDIFRPDRTRYPRLVAGLVARGDAMRERGAA